MAGRLHEVEQTMTEWLEMIKGLDWNVAASKRDEDLANKMKEFVAATYGAAFHTFKPLDAAEFMRLSLPHKVVLELWRHPSKFIMAVGRAWEPSVDHWAEALYLYCGNACNLFGLCFTVNRKITNRKHEESEVGHALFVHLPSVFGDEARFGVQSALGYLVKFVTKNQLVRVHEQKLFELTREFEPNKVGEAVRQLLIYKSRPESCKCGWFVPHPNCTCPMEVELDPLKEYAQGLLYCMAQRRKGKFDQFDRQTKISERLGTKAEENNWNDEQVESLVVNACDGFFSKVSFDEICKALTLAGLMASDGSKPRALKRTRVLTDKETRAHYSGSFMQHNGCIKGGCKTIPSYSCTNFCCGSHCPKIGYLSCKAHKFQGRRMPEIEKEYPGGLKVLFETGK